MFFLVEISETRKFGKAAVKRVLKDNRFEANDLHNDREKTNLTLARKRIIN